MNTAELAMADGLSVETCVWSGCPCCEKRIVLFQGASACFYVTALKAYCVPEDRQCTLDQVPGVQLCNYRMLLNKFAPSRQLTPLNKLAGLSLEWAPNSVSGSFYALPIVNSVAAG
jgi:hypothetical protein